MSASLPTVIEPVRGYSPLIMDALVEVRATNSFKVILPLRTPSENKRGNLVSIPGTPFAIFLKVGVDPECNLPLSS